jgi:hypothetical protein
MSAIGRRRPRLPPEPFINIGMSGVPSFVETLGQARGNFLREICHAVREGRNIG